MMFDMVLPSILFLCASTALALSLEYDKRVKPAFETEFRRRDAVLIVVIMILAVSILAFIPEWAVMLVVLFSFATVLFGVTYTFAGKWYLSILAPILFAALYLFSWNTLLLDLFAMTTIVAVTVLLSASVAWETNVEAQKPEIFSLRCFRGLLVLVLLIVPVDVALVLGTNLMETVARKIIELQLPLLITVPTFPSTGCYASLGLGDIFLSGLLGILTAKKMGRRLGILSVFSMAATLMLGQTALLNANVEAFPATIFVITGWLSAVAAQYCYNSIK